MRSVAFEALQNHVVLRVNPTSPEPGEILCTLPINASREGAIPGGEVDARFGPPAGRFSDRFFAATSADDTVCQVTAAGDCRLSFVLDGETWTRPLGLGFSPNGTRMRVAVSRRVEDEDGRPVTGGSCSSPPAAVRSPCVRSGVAVSYFECPLTWALSSWRRDSSGPGASRSSTASSG